VDFISVYGYGKEKIEGKRKRKIKYKLMIYGK